MSLLFMCIIDVFLYNLFHFTKILCFVGRFYFEIVVKYIYCLQKIFYSLNLSILFWPCSMKSVLEVHLQAELHVEGRTPKSE